ncbi:MAG TPA: c-type cytochrome, partial [Burkholderiaceae bacterium]|nr:c-type cytochrome [Burkholderiaceae bacterium]
PNRNGFTQAHGMLRVQGRPDVQGSRCMKACRDEVRIVSTLPDHARNAHGNLAEQMRPLGPTRGVHTARFETAPAKRETATMAAPAAEVEARAVLARNACTACHGIDHRLVGPGFQEVASRYGGASNADTAARLANRIKQGGVGTWGNVPMPAQPHVKDEDVQVMVKWILGGAR